MHGIYDWESAWLTNGTHVTNSFIEPLPQSTCAEKNGAPCRRLCRGTSDQPFPLVPFRLSRLSVVATWLFAVGSVAGCASFSADNCLPGTHAAVQDALYFGTSKPNGTVTVQEWNSFLNQVITPRFPQGLTSWPAAGQWGAANGEVTREDAYVVHILHPHTVRNEQEIGNIVNAYKIQFQQEAVLRVRTPVCLSF